MQLQPLEGASAPVGPHSVAGGPAPRRTPPGARPPTAPAPAPASAAGGAGGARGASPAGASDSEDDLPPARKVRRAAGPQRGQHTCVGLRPHLRATRCGCSSLLRSSPFGRSALHAAWRRLCQQERLRWLPGVLRSSSRPCFWWAAVRGYAHACLCDSRPTLARGPALRRGARRPPRRASAARRASWTAGRRAGAGARAGAAGAACGPRPRGARAGRG